MPMTRSAVEFLLAHEMRKADEQNAEKTEREGERESEREEKHTHNK